MHENYLKGWLKHTFLSFTLRGSNLQVWVETEILHFYQVPRYCGCFQSSTTLWWTSSQESFNWKHNSNSLANRMHWLAQIKNPGCQSDFGHYILHLLQEYPENPVFLSSLSGSISPVLAFPSGSQMDCGAPDLTFSCCQAQGRREVAFTPPTLEHFFLFLLGIIE